MEKGEKRPFEDTKEFVKEVYEDLYHGELELPKSQIDFEKPFTRIGNKYYQAEYPAIVMRKGDALPLVTMPIDQTPNPSTPVSSRRPNATLLYVFANDKDPEEIYQSEEDIGGLYGVSREMIRQDKANNLLDLYYQATNVTQKNYPFHMIETRRPVTLAMKIKTSLRKGYKTLEIGEMVEQGNPTTEIITQYGSDRVAGSRRTLENWGMRAPERIERSMKGVVDMVKDIETTDEKLVELLPQFNNNGLLQRYGRGKGAILGNVSDLQFKAWGNRNNRKTGLAFQLLRDSTFPVHSFIDGKQTKNGKMHDLKYYIYFLRTEKQAIKILKSHKENIHTKVIQIAGEKLLEVPNTYELRGSSKGSYVRIGSKEVGGSYKQLSELRKLLKGNDFPIPVCEYIREKALYIRSSDVEQFQLWSEQQNLGEVKS